MYVWKLIDLLGKMDPELEVLLHFDDGMAIPDPVLVKHQIAGRHVLLLTDDDELLLGRMFPPPHTDVGAPNLGTPTM